MDKRLQDAKERFLDNPLQTVRKLLDDCKEYDCEITLDELRSIFMEIQNNKEVQRYLDSWGPGDGFCIWVMQDILRTPAVIESIHNDQPVYPSVLELHMGPVCPCACTFCYSKGETKLGSNYCDYSPGTRALTPDQILSIVSVLVDRGCNSIYFSGGLEPFSTRTTVDVLRGLPDEPKVGIYTNGVPDILSGDVLELAVKRASRLRFSIHAATPKTYAIVQMPHRNDGENIFHEVTKRVKEALSIQRILKDSNMPAAQIGVTFLTVPANHTEIEQAVLKWAEAGLDFFDIGNDALTEDSRTDKLSEQQKEQLRESFRKLRMQSDSGQLGKMWVRPSRESVQNVLKPDAGICYAPLFKAVIDPYGTRWACCMRAHPALQHGKFRIGQSVTCGKDFVNFSEQQSDASRNLREIPLPWHCHECTEFEYVANICLKKIFDDLDVGIKLSEQPFVPKALTHTKAGS